MASSTVPDSIPSAMRAWQYSKYGGGADALQLSSTVPVPKPKQGEVLVRVQAASINPVDWKLQSGILRPFLPPSFPCIPGFDVAGEVVETGPQAGSLVKGDQVFGMVDLGRGGILCEYTVLSAKAAARRPAKVPPAEAACLGVAALTALQGLRDWGKVPFGPDVLGFEDEQKHKAAGPAPQSVLVANAAGGVGHYAVQLAKLAGLRVAATCGQRNMEWVKSLGADEVLDYKTPEGQALRKSPDEKYDIVYDGTLSLTWKTVGPVLASPGKWLHLTPNFSAITDSIIGMATFSKQRVYPVLCTANASDLSTLAKLAAEGKLKTRIDAEVPFDKAPDAWRKSLEGHVTGKIVVVMDSK